MKKIFTILITAAFPFLAEAQLTPVQSLNLSSVPVDVPVKFKATLPGNYSVNLPDGYRARIFYAGGLAKPRFLSFDQHGVLHVADYNNGKIFAMPDHNDDGIADTLIEAAVGFNLCHDVKFYNGHMYVTEERKVWKLTDAGGDGVYESREVFIDNIGANAPNPSGGHRTRTIVFDDVNQKVYLSIGSACNACRENFRAVIEQYNIDGTNGHVYATGVRNAVGMTMHPVTNRLWANNNGSDWQGNEIPPEWFDLVRQNGFYGYPLAYGDGTWFNFNAHPDYQALLPLTASDSMKVDAMIMPAAQLEAHSAPMALTFLNSAFPPVLRNGMLTALRGSWNAPGDHRGYKLSFISFGNVLDTTADYVADFCTGFLTDSVSPSYWARPVGLAVNGKGEIFMSSDETNRFIMHIYPENPTGLNNYRFDDEVILASDYENRSVSISFSQKLESGIIEMYDNTGRLIQSHRTKGNQETIDTAVLGPGLYYLMVRNVGRTAVKKFVIPW